MEEGLLRVLQSGSALALAKYIGYNRYDASNHYLYLEEALLSDTLSPLAIACDVRHVVCVRWLLQVAKVDIKHHTLNIVEPLQLSCNNLEIMKLLLTAGVDPQPRLITLISWWWTDSTRMNNALKLLIDYGARAGPSTLHQSANIDTLMFVDGYQRQVECAVATCTVLYGIVKHKLRSNALPIGDLIKLIAKHAWDQREEIHSL